MPAVIIGCSCRSGWRRMRDSNSRGVAPNTLSNNAPQRSYQAGAVRDLGRPWPLGLGGRPRIPANETTNDTAAESGRLTLASSSAGILLGLTRGRLPAKPVAPRRADRRHQGYAEGMASHWVIGMFAKNARRAAYMCLRGAPPGSAAAWRTGRSVSGGSGWPPHKDGPQAWAVVTVGGSAA